jgi:hypothetical protein
MSTSEHTYPMVKALFLHALNSPPSSLLSPLTFIDTGQVRKARNTGRRKGKDNKATTAPLHYLNFITQYNTMPQWNSDSRVCRLPMPRISRLGAKARDAGVYVAGGLVNVHPHQQFDTAKANNMLCSHKAPTGLPIEPHSTVCCYEWPSPCPCSNQTPTS